MFLLELSNPKIKPGPGDAGLFMCGTPVETGEDDGYGAKDSYNLYSKEQRNARTYLISRVGKKYDNRDIYASDKPEDLISLSMPKQMNEDTMSLFYSYIADEIINRYIDTDPIVKKYEELIDDIIKTNETGLNELCELYNKDQLPDVVKQFHTKIEQLNFPIMKNKTWTIKTIEVFNDTVKIFEYGPEYNITLNFKNYYPETPW